MTRTLSINRLRQRGTRNLQPAEFHFSPHLNVLWGDNGQGKTSLLETLVLAATGRSFRTDQSRDVISHDQALATIEIEVDEAGLTRKQRVELGLGRKSTSVDEKRVQRAADYAVRTPVVVFHPGDLELVSGPAALRRTLLARVSLYLEPCSFESYKAYQVALRERQRLLLDRGPRAPGLDAFEQVAAQHGVLVTASNARAAQQLIEAIEPILARLAPDGLRLGIRHLVSGTTDVPLFRQQLEQSRVRDQSRGRALYGPQRDDLLLTLDGTDARRHASQGQQRLLALALKLAELASIRLVRGVHPILLLDDVSSELDPQRTGALRDWLRESESQVFITTTRWETLDRQIFPRFAPSFFRLKGGVAEQEEPAPTMP